MSDSVDRQLVVPQGSFTLDRYPLRRKQQLRAWDAADEYLLQHLAAEGVSAASVLVLNDSFGALTTALASAETTAAVQMSSDSFLAHAGTRENLAGNRCDAAEVAFLDSLTAPSQTFKVLLFKVPKSLAVLEDQLQRLRSYLSPDTLIIGAGMSKQIHTSTLEACERWVGQTTTSLAKKKARLIHCTFDPTPDVPAESVPTCYPLEGTGFQLSNHAALFARERLDYGTRLLLEHLPRSPQARCIVDLGCGNGVLGIVAGRHHRDASLVFADESAMAVDSARQNVVAILGEERDTAFHWTDCLDGIETACADVVLCNPPFHQQQSVGDATAWQMFTEARRVLEQDGSIWVVGNRHLGYHRSLRRLFGNCEVVASNPKFVILKATKL